MKQAKVKPLAAAVAVVVAGALGWGRARIVPAQEPAQEAALPTSPATLSEPPTPTVTMPAVTWWGGHSKIMRRRYARVNSVPEWVKLWHQHTGKSLSADSGYTYYNPNGVPRVDFDKYMVVAVFQGEGGNNAGVEAASVAESGDEVILRFFNHSSQSAALRSQPPGRLRSGSPVASAYGMFLLPRTAKAIVLEEDTHSRKGNARVWTERARLPKP